MRTTTLTAADALELAARFRKASIAVGNYLYDPANWPRLPLQQRATLQSLELTLLTVSSDLVTRAVDVIIEDARQSVEDLMQATERAAEVLDNITDIKHAISLVTALIGLAAAIPTGSAGTIYAAFKNVKASVATLAEPAGKPAAAAKNAVPTGAN